MNLLVKNIDTHISWLSYRHSKIPNGIKTKGFSFRLFDRQIHRHINRKIHKH